MKNEISVEWLELTEEQIMNEGIDGREWCDEISEADNKYEAVECIYENADVYIEKTSEHGADYVFDRDGEKRYVFVK